MNFDTMIFIIIMSLFLLIMLNIAYFIEASAIFEFFFKLLFPKKTIKKSKRIEEFEEI